MPHPPRPYDPGDYDASSVKLDRFLKAARDQIGDKYRFGAEASEDDANPSAFDSSELVEWAAHRAGFHDMPDGSWNQYRYLHEQGASVPVEEALRTKGALVFGFSEDPLASPDRPARAYVGISLGDGKSVLDVSERSGQVRVMDHGGFYGYGATIPEFHAPDDSVPPPDIWSDRDGDGIPDDAAPTTPADPLPDSIEIDTDGDGIPDSSLPRPPFPGEIDTDGDGVPDSSVPDPPVLDPRPGRPVLVPDRRTTEDGPGDIIYEQDDDPVTPSAPGNGHGPSGQLIDQDLPGGAEPGSTASYFDEPPLDDLAYDPAADGIVAPAEPAPTPAAEVTAYADAADLAASPSSTGDDAGYGVSTYSDSTYSDSYADSYTDLSAEA